MAASEETAGDNAAATSGGTTGPLASEQPKVAYAKTLEDPKVEMLVTQIEGIGVFHQVIALTARGLSAHLDYQPLLGKRYAPC